MTLEHDGGSAGDDLTCNGGAKTGSVLSLTRGPSPGCLQRPAFHASPGAQGDETAMAGRSALQIGLPVRRGLRRQGDRCGPDAAMVAGCHSAMGAGTGTRNLPLKEISRTVAKGAQAAVLMARAPGHTSGEVKGPETLIFLPARSPELNRVGKVWQSLRENGLSNRLLEDQADGLAAGCGAWTRLMKEPTGASRD